jgi:hypothetical protein
MDNFFLTTFNIELYNKYAKNLINTYIETKQIVPLICYVEEDDFTIYPQYENITYYNLYREVPEIKKFIERNKNRKVISYIYDGIRFCYKVYAQYAGRNLGKRQFFIDADCVFRKQIPEEWYDNFIGDCDFSYYPRPSYYSETGFIAFNCLSELTQKFFEEYIGAYNSDQIYNMRSQNDSVVFDIVLKNFPQRTEKLHGLGDNLDPKYHKHVMARCPILSPYIDHKKGNRKVQRNSLELVK